MPVSASNSAHSSEKQSSLVDQKVISEAGCTSLKSSAAVVSASEDAAADAAVTLQIAEDSLTKTGARITLYNGSDSEIQFGRSYFLQTLQEEAWSDIDGEQDWTLELIVLEPGQSYEETLDWSSYYGELPAGAYRIVKTYHIGDISETEESYVKCEFHIDD